MFVAMMWKLRRNYQFVSGFRQFWSSRRFEMLEQIGFAYEL